MIRLALAACLPLLAGAQPAPSPRDFATLAGQAHAAREGGRLAEAQQLYQQALRLRADWKEGLWYLGTVLYEQDKYSEAQPVFKSLLKLDPNLASAWALLGLSEFQTAEFDEALDHLRRAERIGLPNNAGLRHSVRYHLVLLLNRSGQHEVALNILHLLARDAPAAAQLIEAAGLTGLRLTILPHDIPAARRPLIMAAGEALWYAAARQPSETAAAFDRLLLDHSNEANVHFLYASYLIVNDPERAIQHLRRELEISPTHVPAMVSLAFEYLKIKDAASAIPFAARAAQTAPSDFAARTAYGQALLENGQFERAATELEAAVKLSPDSPQVRFALAAAYRKLNRKEDAQREHAEFLRLQKLAGERR
jgi:tetratricopeptide (TPR) repeat protein